MFYTTGAKPARALVALAACLTAFAAAPVRAGVTVDKLEGEAFTDMGQIVRGSLGGTQTLRDEYLSRMGVSLTAQDTVGGKLVVRVGVGGLFWQSYPLGDFWQNTIQFGPGISEASAKVLVTPQFTVQGGYFPFKYNGSARNLGEYLLRSESYPTVLSTGGWTWVDSAYTNVLGVRVQASHLGGKFRHEAGVYAEMQTPPLFDLTPAYLFSWKPVKGLEVGGGVAFKRWFQPQGGYRGDAAKDSMAAAAARYMTVANFPEVQNHAVVHYTYDNGSGPVAADTFVVWRGGASFDAATTLAGKPGATVTNLEMTQYGSAAGVRKGIQMFLENAWYSANGADCYSNCTAYLDGSGNLLVTDGNGNVIADTTVKAIVTSSREITRRAINVMGRVGYDFAEAFDLTGTGPFKAYAEIAVLGVQNQPVYYEDVTERMPIMFGLHVPTFGLLDLLAVEGEYLNNPNRDSWMLLSVHKDRPFVTPDNDLGGESLAIPDLDAADFRKSFYDPKSFHSDDWKWSVHAVRTIVPGLKVKVQAANDHFRTHKLEFNGPSLTPYPLTLGKRDWYYLVHLQWGF
jgi:hypothetical protein